MADFDDNAARNATEPAPRREPPTIEAEAVELPIDGGAAPDAGRAKPALAGVIAALTARRRLVAASVAASLAAVILGAALWWALAPRGSGGDDLRSRIALLEAGQRADAARLAANASATATLSDLSARIARLEGAASRPEAPAEDSARLAGLEDTLKAMTARLDDLDRRSRDDAAAARSAGERADRVAAEIAELKKDGAGAPAPAPEDASAGFAARLDGLEARLKTTSEQVDGAARAAATAAAAAATRPLRAALAAAALRLAVERDDPFTQELDAARAIGLDPAALAALAPFAASGVPSVNELTRELSALVPELVRVTTPAGRDGNYLDRLQASAERLVRIRPVGDAPGDDPATVIGRIELKTARRDLGGLGGLLADVDKLPAPARELAQPWRARALGRAAAIDAARRLAALSFARPGDAPAPR